MLGSFRFPPEALAEARPMMRTVIAATRAEPGLFRVTELWASREALSAHIDTPHMRAWSERRAALGFADRRIALHEIGAAEDL